MITYNIALTIAHQRGKQVSRCVEYPSAFIFFCDTEEHCVGGVNAPLVVIKDNGATDALPNWAIKHGDEAVINEYFIEPVDGYKRFEENSSIITPLGRIKITIDGVETTYKVRKGRPDPKHFPDVLGRYQLVVSFQPDGNEHRIQCIIDTSNKYVRDNESDENITGFGIYDFSNKMKVSMSTECENGYIDGVRCSNAYDYDASWVKNGLEIIILPETKTSTFHFMASWIDKVPENEMGGERDFQAEAAVDPYYWDNTILIGKKQR